MAYYILDEDRPWLDKWWIAPSEKKGSLVDNGLLACFYMETFAYLVMSLLFGMKKPH